MAEFGLQLRPNMDFTIQAPDAAGMALGGFYAGQENVAQQQRMGLAQSADGRAQVQLGMDQERLAIDQQDAAMRQTAFTQAQQERVAMVTRAKEAQAAFGELYDKIEAGTATASDIAQLTIAYPELSEGVKQAVDGMAQEQKSSYTSLIFQAATALKLGKPEVAAKLFEDHATAAENSGQQDDAAIARAMAETVKTDPAAALGTLGVLAQSVDPDINTEVFGAGGGKSLQSSVTLADGTAVMTFTDGSRRVTDAAGTVLEGPDATAAVKAAQEYEAELAQRKAAGTATGRLGAEIELGGEAAAATEAGKQAITKASEAFDALSKVNANIITIDTALDALAAGANSGAIARYLPNISGASASLENAMNRLGLDVIGSVTFGALSEAEMRLAMETAVPRNLNEADLKAWLERKKAAQEKASDALYNAAVYLGTPGNTVAKWLTEKRAGGGAAGDPGSPPPAVPTPEQADAWLREFGGAP